MEFLQNQPRSIFVPHGTFIALLPSASEANGVKGLTFFLTKGGESMRKTKDRHKRPCSSYRQTQKELKRKNRLKILILVALVKVLSILSLFLDHYWTMS